MIRPAADETTPLPPNYHPTRDAMGIRWPKQARYTVRRKWTGGPYCMRGEELEWQRLQGLQGATA